MSENKERFSPGQRLRYIGTAGWPKHGIAAGAIGTYVGPDKNTRGKAEVILNVLKLAKRVPDYDSKEYKSLMMLQSFIEVEFDDVPKDSDLRTCAPETEFVPLDDDEKDLDNDIRSHKDAGSWEEFISKLGIDPRKIEVQESAPAEGTKNNDVFFDKRKGKS